MSPTIQILPPVTPSVRYGSTAGSHRGSSGALVDMAGWRAASTRAPLFSHAGAPDLPVLSPGFLAQHLAQEWSSGDKLMDPARVAAAYSAPVGAGTPGIGIQAAA